MSTAGCGKCAGTMQNTGFPNVKPFGVMKGKGFQRLVADDGTRNGIDSSSATLEQDILDAVNNPDPSKRLFLFTNIQNASSPEADPIFATTELNERFKTAEGITNVLWEMWGVTEQFFDKVQSQCSDFGDYDIDICSNFKGQREGTAIIYPRPVNKNSYKAKFMPATATETSKVMFNYDYEYTTNDGDQWQIAADAFGANKPLDLKSIIDVNLAITVNSATSLTVSATMDYGYMNEQTPWKGALLADFTAINVVVPAVPVTIVITSVTPTLTAGEYAIVVPAQVAADHCTLKAFHAATGVILNGYESATTDWIAQ